MPVHQATFYDSVIRGISDRVDKHASEEQVFVLYGGSYTGHYVIGDFEEVPNTHANPQEGFRAEVDESPKGDLYPVGIVHTHVGRHPKAPSEHDLDTAILFPSLLHVVYHARKRTVAFYDHNGVFSRGRWW